MPKFTDASEYYMAVAEPSFLWKKFCKTFLYRSSCKSEKTVTDKWTDEGTDMVSKKGRSVTAS